LLAVAVLGPALLAPACKVYPDSLLDPLPGGGSGSPAASSSGGTGLGFWSGPNQDGCLSASYPTSDQRPAPGDTTEIPPIYLAISRLWLGSQNLSGQLDKNAWQDFGFDLDHTCTLSPTCNPDADPVSCQRKISSVPPDGNNCRDNNFGRFEYFVVGVPEIGKKYGLNDDTFNCGLCFGKYNILIRLSGYNGQPNDDQVRVDLYDSPGLEMPLNFACDSTATAQLCWLPDSPFLINRASMASPQDGPALSDAVLNDAQAYVRDGYVVVQLPERATLNFPGKSDGHRTYPLTLTRGLVTAKVNKSADGTWQLSDGVIAGRVKGDDVIQGFRRLGFCESDPFYGTMTSYVAANLDIYSDPAASSDVDCDSISMAVAFTAGQATPGKLADVDPLVDCPSDTVGGSGGAAGAGGEAGAGGDAGAGGLKARGQPRSPAHAGGSEPGLSVADEGARSWRRASASKASTASVSPRASRSIPAAAAWDSSCSRLQP
jgi:hypothetical protein